MIHPPTKEGMHPRNRFREGYDFRELGRVHPPLTAYVRLNPHGDSSVDFSNPDAVKALNHALLRHAYGIRSWDLPSGYLCPPVPGRSDYIHALADLVKNPAAPTPKNRSIRILDIGVGANCIYPLIGASEYGWRFVGTDVDPKALGWASKLVAANPQFAGLIEFRPQSDPNKCFDGVLQPGERFDASMCNPPFFASAAEAEAGNLRKNRNLGASAARSRVRNFGGHAGELWCRGGEVGFVQRMIEESVSFRDQCRWFTTLVSKSAHLPRLRARLKDAGVADTKIIEIAHGQKQSRILAWTY